MAEPTLTAQETKEQVLWTAQEMLRSRPRRRHRGQPRRTPPRRQRGAHAVLARLPGDDARRPRRLRPRRERARGRARPDQREGAAPRRRSGMHPEIHATMHCHAKHATMFALVREPIPAVIEEFDVFVGGDVEVRRLQDDRHRRARRGGRQARRGPGLCPHGEPRAVRRRPHPEGRAAHRVARRAHRGDRVGCARCSATIVPLPDEVGKQFQGYYRYGRTGKF